MNENERIAAGLQQLNRSAVAAVGSGALDEGLELFRKALAIEDHLGFTSHAAETLLNIATTCLMLEDLPEALAAVDGALELFQRQRRPDDQRRALSLRAEVLHRSGHNREAAQSLENALRLSPISGERANLYFQAAVVYRHQEQHFRAQEYLGRALAEFDQTGNKRGASSCLQERATLFEAIDRHDLAARDRQRWERMQNTRGTN